MRFPTINKSDPDRAFSLYHNNEGGAIAYGDVVEFDIPADSGALAGKSVEKADSAAATLVAGVSFGATLGGGTSVAAGEYGWMVVYGYHPAVKTDDAIAAAGAALTATATGTATNGTEGTQTLGIFGVSLAADAGSPAVVPAIVRCM